MSASKNISVNFFDIFSILWYSFIAQAIFIAWYRYWGPLEFSFFIAILMIFFLKINIKNSTKLKIIQNSKLGFVWNFCNFFLHPFTNFNASSFILAQVITQNVVLNKSHFCKNGIFCQNLSHFDKNFQKISSSDFFVILSMLSIFVRIVVLSTSILKIL